MNLTPTRRMAWFLAALAPVLLWSAHAPHDRFTWWLEVMPLLIAVPLMLATQHRFPLSTLLLVLIALHGCVLLVGGHYTYALTPLGEWARDWFGWQRNDYDKLGHFAQGFVPALVAREIFARASPLQGHPRWMAFFSLTVVMTVSASYELIEWLTAVSAGSDADAFLGTQGDPWDTQTDMAMALVGGLCSWLLIPWHDRSLRALRRPAP